MKPAFQAVARSMTALLSMFVEPPHCLFTETRDAHFAQRVSGAAI